MGILEWWATAAAQIREIKGFTFASHADEIETSVVLATPEGAFVRLDAATVNSTTLEALTEGESALYRSKIPFTRGLDDRWVGSPGNMGDPTRVTAEKGERIIRQAVTVGVQLAEVLMQQAAGGSCSGGPPSAVKRRRLMMVSDRMVQRVIREETIPPAGHFAAEMRKNQVLRIVDVEGQQVADLVCFKLDNLQERLSVMNTISLNRQVFPRIGYLLFSDEASPLMTIIDDTCGVHDMLAGACSRFTNERRYGVKDTRNCRDNLAEALKPWGIGWKDIPFNMNVFMNCPIGPDGSWSIQTPRSKANDHIDFRAEADVLVAFSNCPQVHNACNAFHLKPLRALIYEYKPQ